MIDKIVKTSPPLARAPLLPPNEVSDAQLIWHTDSAPVSSILSEIFYVVCKKIQDIRKYCARTIPALHEGLGILKGADAVSAPCQEILKTSVKEVVSFFDAVGWDPNRDCANWEETRLAKEPDIIIGIDAGTSVVKAVAFNLEGVQVASAAVKNEYALAPDGSATQSMPKTWMDCATAIKSLGDRVEHLSSRTAAIAITGQGDGTWLLDKTGKPFTDAWLWLDARAAPTVKTLVHNTLENERFQFTGTGLNTCQQGSQLAHMSTHHPELLENAATAFHCKDWLYFNLTGIRATDPSEASFTFGDFRTRNYSENVIASLGLSERRYLLPDIVDGVSMTHPLSTQAAAQTGLLKGTPVCLGYVDMIMTGLGAGVYTGQANVACSTIGSTGVHMRACRASDVVLGSEHTGYVLCLPAEGMVAHSQTNMAATLNIDWLLELASDLLGEFGEPPSRAQLFDRLDGWIDKTELASLLYHPYISDAGERGPFIDPNARASFQGLSANHRFPDLVRGVLEGLGMAARDCYSAMGDLPAELRITGGAARSSALRSILSASLNAPVRVSAREEAGAAGSAMMAAVAIGAFDKMDACVSTWVTPLLGDLERPDPDLTQTYNHLFEIYKQGRAAMAPSWNNLSTLRRS